ncbi:hypothetical protein LVD15_11985 [Fulvivirga maritima]|uniref:hypothetical protein n=1 Tax=Fulvivirga maritima TaxID=2904247 RepID=UPI001F41ABA0|nr:hypothetical protein [Fulvivirga maritima]UII29115.1 hypothetical protein LVD15_11985 [Fulvivirga maritima]
MVRLYQQLLSIMSLNQESQLLGGVTVFQFLKLIISASKDLTGWSYVMVTRSLLAQLPKDTRETIDYCVQHEFVEVKKLGQSHEYWITRKGREFYEMEAKKDGRYSG